MSRLLPRSYIVYSNGPPASYRIFRRRAMAFRHLTNRRGAASGPHGAVKRFRHAASSGSTLKAPRLAGGYWPSWRFPQISSCGSLSCAASVHPKSLKMLFPQTFSWLVVLQAARYPTAHPV